MTDDAAQLFLAADLHEELEQSRAEAVALPFVADDDGELRLVEPVQLAQAADAENLVSAAQR